MNFTFYTNKSDSNVVDKDITNVTSLELNILTPLDVRNFEIVITNVTDNINYCYVEELDRYYYLEKVYDNKNQVRYRCVCDVLMSFASEIKKITATLKRSSNIYNGYLPDNDFQCYAYTKIVTKKFPNSMINDSIILMTVG